MTKSKHSMTKKEFLKKVKLSSLEFHLWETALAGHHCIQRSENNARKFTEEDYQLLKELIALANKTSLTKEEAVSKHFPSTTVVPVENELIIIDKDQSPMDQLVTVINKQLEQNLEKIKEEIISSLHNQNERTNQRLHSMDSHLKLVTNTITDSSSTTQKEIIEIEKQLMFQHKEQQEKLNNLIETIEENRITTMEVAKMERDRYYQDINDREAVFQDLITNFRQAAAAKEVPPKNNWWQFWKF